MHPAEIKGLSFIHNNDNDNHNNNTHDNNIDNNNNCKNNKKTLVYKKARHRVKLAHNIKSFYFNCVRTLKEV